jgi:hypothetical protein
LDEGLERGWGIGQPKRHHLILEMAISGSESRFLNVILMDPDLVVPRTEINLGKDLGTMESVYQVINQWDGEPVLDGDLV